MADAACTTVPFGLAEVLNEELGLRCLNIVGRIECVFRQLLEHASIP